MQSLGFALKRVLQLLHSIPGQPRWCLGHYGLVSTCLLDTTLTDLTTRSALRPYLQSDQVAISYPKQIEHCIESQRGDAMLSRLSYDGFRMKGDAQSRAGQHREIVGPVTNRDCLFAIHTLFVGELFQQAGFSLSIDDWPDHSTSQTPSTISSSLA